MSVTYQCSGCDFVTHDVEAAFVHAIESARTHVVSIARDRVGANACCLDRTLAHLWHSGGRRWTDHRSRHDGVCPECQEIVHDADCPRVGDGRPVEG